MKGFVPTPDTVVDFMVDKLFARHPPSPDSVVLDPGCGPGAFVAGIVRWCERHGAPMPRVIGVDSDPRHVAEAATRFADTKRIRFWQADFLASSPERFNYIVGNPPYVPITRLTIAERQAYRARYATARGRFDLYLLFFEQALSLLKPGGRLAFITPEKFLYVETAEALRKLLCGFQVDELCFLDEGTFPGLVTYPLVTTVTAAPPSRPTRITHRDGQTTEVHLGPTATSWLPVIRGSVQGPVGLTLADISIRVSCGIATGADAVFVVPDARLHPRLRPYAHPTIAGREIVPGKPLSPAHSMLIPYRLDGRLLPEHELGDLGRYLREPRRQERLLARTCVERKPWYAFHENPPLHHVLRPKLLCKDIGARASFVPDRDGAIVPRHSVYYLVPANPECLDELADYLGSRPAQAWLQDHCQRAANSFLRLQSHVLKRLPLPSAFEAHRREEGAELELSLQPA